MTDLLIEGDVSEYEYMMDTSKIKDPRSITKCRQ